MDNWIILKEKCIEQIPLSYIFYIKNLNYDIEKILLENFENQLIFTSVLDNEIKLSFNDLLNNDQEKLLFKIIFNK